MRGASFALGTGPSTRHQSQDCRQVVQTADGRGSEGRSKEAALHGSQRNRGSHNRRVLPAHALATRRLPLCTSAVDSASVGWQAMLASPRSRRRKASSISFWVLTGPTSLQSHSLWTRRIVKPRGRSSKFWSRHSAESLILSHSHDPLALTWFAGKPCEGNG